MGTEFSLGKGKKVREEIGGGGVCTMRMYLKLLTCALKIWLKW